MHSERTGSEYKGSRYYPHNMAHLNLLWDLNDHSVEILCIDGCSPQDVVAIKFLEQVSDSGNVTTLILSRDAVESCFSVLSGDLGPLGHGRWSSSIQSLIIHPESDPPYRWRNQLLRKLLNLARKKKAAGVPFRSVLVFLCDGPEWGWESESESESELRECVGKLEVVRGDDVLDWDVDKYFLDGLDRLQKIRDVQWDQEGMYHRIVGSGKLLALC